MGEISHPIISSVYLGSNDYTSMVEGQFASANSWASSAVAQTESLLTNLSEIVSGIAIPDPGDLTLNLPDVPEFNVVDAPTFEGTLTSEAAPTWDLSFEEIPAVEYTPPGNPPEFEGTSDVPTIEPPEMPEMASPPTFTTNFNTSVDTNVEVPSTFIHDKPNKPSITFSSLPSSDVSLESVTLPDSPEIKIPDIPILADINVPSPPVIDIPSFDAKKPTLGDLLEIEDLQYEEEVYISLLQTSLVDRFTDTLTGDPNGKGTGIPANVEAEIYNRGILREKDENNKLTQEVDDQFSATGFSLPSGTYAARKLEVTNIISDKSIQLSREIMVNQAELEQKNIHHVIEQGIVLEGKLIDFFNQKQNRNLEVARSTVQASIDVLNAMIEQQKAKLAVYQTEANVFETKLKSELTKAEIYKAQVEGTKASASVQAIKVETYTAQVKALTTTADLYRIQMESAKIQAEIESEKIELYKARVEAYAATINAESTKIELYNADVNAENTRAIVYGEEIKGYQAKVQAKAVEVELKTAQADMELKNNQLIMDGFKGEIEAFKAKIEGVKAVADIGRLEVEAAINQNTGKVKVFEAETNAFRSQVDGAKAETDGQKAAVDGRIAANNAKVEQSKAQNEAFVSITNAKTQQYIGQVEAYKSQIEAFTAEMNGLAKQFDANIAAYQAEVSSTETQLRVALGQFEVTSNSILAAKGIAADAAGHAATASSNLAAGAMNAVNVSASVGSKTSRSHTETGHDSISEQHTFHYSSD